MLLLHSLFFRPQYAACGDVVPKFQNVDQDDFSFRIDVHQRSEELALSERGYEIQDVIGGTKWLTNVSIGEQEIEVIVDTGSSTL